MSLKFRLKEVYLCKKCKSSVKYSFDPQLVLQIRGQRRAEELREMLRKAREKVLLENKIGVLYS